MPEKNLNQRLLVIAIVVLVGIWLLYPPSERLRPGLDIAGGTSLIFEIDDTGADERSDLAERVKTLLQKRVDPQGVYNLTWRVHGKNRIEVQMPLPPRDAKQRRDDYNDALTALFDREIRRGDIEAALLQTGAARDEALQTLAHRHVDEALAASGGGDAESAPSREEIEGLATRRLELLHEAAQRYDAYRDAAAALQAGAPATTQPTTGPATQPTPQEELELVYRDTEELFDDAVDSVLATNINRRRFQEVLELQEGSQTRQQSLTQIKAAQPHLVRQIDDVLAKYATYREGKRFLDGPGDLKRLVRGAGKLEFRILEPPSPDNPTKYDRYRRQLRDERREIVPGDRLGWFKIDEPMQFFSFESPAELAEFKHETDPTHVLEKVGDEYYVLAKLESNDGLLQGDKTQRPWKLRGARVDRDENGRPSVSFSLDVVGGGMFETLTRTNIGKQLCILVDNVAYSSAEIRSAIRTSGQITGEFSPDKVRYLVQTMEGGMLPGRLKDTPLSEITIGSSLGEVNRDSAVRAGLYGAIAVVLVMTFYYWYCGAIAVVALSMNVVLVLAALAMLNARITLDGIAGIILAVGMAVDANVLIYERMREEKDRGASLRMIVKNGYDKALSTIFDSNITTLLTCVIIYYVGSEEVKGFGLTLGWGIVLNLFTSVFVTRTLFTFLLKYNLIKNIGMMRLIGVPTIDWYSKRKFFLPLSFAVLALGLFLLWERGRDNVLDVEFLGGVTAEVEFKPPPEGEPALNDRDIRDALASVAERIRDDAELLNTATVTPVSDSVGAYRVRVDGIDDGPRLAAMITEPLEAKNLLERKVGDGGVVATSGQPEIIVYLQSDKTQEQLTAAIHGLNLKDDANNLGKASVNAVLSVGDVEQTGRVWNVTTTVTNMRLVEDALKAALGDHMKIQPSIQYVFRGAGDRPYPITARNLADVVPGLPLGVNASLTDYLGGAAMYLDQLDPPQALDALRARINNMHFKPDYADQPRRDFDVLGIERAGEQVDDEGRPLYRGVVVVSMDPDVPYSVDPEAWWENFAEDQLSLVRTALSTEQTLRRVMQFKPQIAAQSTRQASVALLLAWAMIIGYVWIRFGRPIYGVAAVSALIHDALIALAFVGFSGWIGGANHPFGNALLISDFKINMTIVAAMLTIIGYSVNDSIVVFDRIRETRGRLGVVTPEVINTSINQTLSRTVMTSMTTLVVLSIMYIVGGDSIRGFNYCMMIGIITGSYSSIAIAAPLLMARLPGSKDQSRNG